MGSSVHTPRVGLFKALRHSAQSCKVGRTLLTVHERRNRSGLGGDGQDYSLSLCLCEYIQSVTGPAMLCTVLTLLTFTRLALKYYMEEVSLHVTTIRVFFRMWCSYYIFDILPDIAFCLKKTRLSLTHRPV